MVEFVTLEQWGGREAAAFMQIYREALPPREQKSEAAISAMLARPDYRVILAEQAGACVGFAVTCHGPSMTLLEYMAVEAGRRGEGLGGEIYRRARAEAKGLPFLLEVDSEAEPSFDRDLRARRKAFYRRLGCRQVDRLAYILPLPGDGPPPAMDLLADNVAAAEVSRGEVATWLSEIYAGAYGCGPGDPRLAAMISDLPDPVPLL